MKLLNTLVSDKERVKTGLFLIAFVAIVGIVDSFWLTWAFLGAVFLVGFYEAMKLFGVDNSSWLCLYAGIVWIGGAFYPQPVDLIFVALAILASMLAYKGELEQKLFLPLLYPGISLLFMLSLYNEFGMIALNIFPTFLTAAKPSHSSKLNNPVAGAFVFLNFFKGVLCVNFKPP